MKKSSWITYLILYIPLFFTFIIFNIYSERIPLGIIVAKYFWLYFTSLLLLPGLIYMSFIRKPKLSLVDLLIAFSIIALMLTARSSLSNLLDNKKALYCCSSAIVFFYIRRFLSEYKDFDYTALFLLSPLFITAIFSSAFAILQNFNMVTSFNPVFNISGTFLHPAPFAGFLACIFPLSLYYSYSATNNKCIHVIMLRYLAIFTGIIIIITLPLLSSRAAFLALLAGSVYLFAYFQGVNNTFCLKAKIFLRKPVNIVIIATVCLFALIVMYNYRQESVNGRFLIWKISSQMFFDSPLLGHGIDSFKYKYPSYQINYFKTTRPQAEVMLSDEVTSTFNELLQILYETGLVGLIIFFLVIYFTTKKRSGQHDSDKYNLTIPAKASLYSFLCFSLFSYPLSILELVLLFFIILAFASNFYHLTLQTRSLAYAYRLFVIFLSITLLTGVENKLYEFQNYRRWYQITQVNDHVTATNLYRDLFKSFKTSEAFSRRCAVLLAVNGEYEASLQVLKSIKRKSYDNLMLLGNNSFSLKRYKIAKSYFWEAHFLMPHKFKPLGSLLNVYMHLDSSTSARKIAEKIILMKVKLNSADVQNIQITADSLLKLKLTEEPAKP